MTKAKVDWIWDDLELKYKDKDGNERPKPKRGSPEFKVITDRALVTTWRRVSTFNKVAKRFWWYSPVTLRQRASDIRAQMKKAGISKAKVEANLPTRRHVKPKVKQTKDKEYWASVIL